MILPNHVLNPKGRFIVVVPHTGVVVPEETGVILTDEQKGHMDKYSAEFYTPFTDIGATVIFSDVHRYVVEANRGRDDTSDMGSVMTIDFQGNPIARPDIDPGSREEPRHHHHA